MTTFNFNDGSETCLDGAHFHFHVFGLGQGSCLRPTENWSDIMGSGKGQVFKKARHLLVGGR